KQPPAPLGVDSSTISPPGGTAARSDARVAAASPGQRATSEQCRLWMVSPRPALASPAVSTRYSLSRRGNTICRALAREVISAPARKPSLPSPRKRGGRFSRKRWTTRKISSAARWSCATCTVRVPGRVMVCRKKRAATRVVALHGVGSQRDQVALLVADLQQRPHHQVADSAVQG